MFISLRQGKHGCASFQLVSALTMFVLALYHANRTFFSPNYHTRIIAFGFLYMLQ